MQKNTRHILILSTCPDAGVAGAIAQALVTDRIAACVNIIPGITSRFRWKGQIESSDEQLLLIKTTSDRYQDAEKKIRTMHPYELPEIIAIPVTLGLADYLNWIDQETQYSS